MRRQTLLFIALLPASIACLDNPIDGREINADGTLAAHKGPAGLLNAAVGYLFYALIALILVYVLGGIVIVEVVFGYPGLGQYLLDSALYKDINALEAGTMIMVLMAVSTQLVADIIYTCLNPRIRYA